MYVKVCAEEKVAGIEFSGTPLDKVAGMEAVEMLKKAGVKMFHKVGALRHAQHAEKIGFDGIYAAGIEEGGHPLNDDVTSMVRLPRLLPQSKFRWSLWAALPMVEQWRQQWRWALKA